MTLTKDNFRDYPLKVLNHAHPAILQMREYAKNYPGVIDEENSEIHLIKFIDLHKESDFYFTVETVDVYGGGNIINILIRIYCNPHDETIGGNGKFDLKVEDDLLPYFKAWISFVLSYGQFASKLSPEDAIQKKYEQEFKEYFILLDESAEYEPFPIETQFKLIQLLTHIEDRLERLEEKTEESERILLETRKLKMDIPNLTKAQTVNRLSKIWAWTRKIGFEGMKKVFDMAIEAAVKSVFDGSALKLLHAIHKA